MAEARGSPQTDRPTPTHGLWPQRQIDAANLTIGAAFINDESGEMLRRLRTLRKHRGETCPALGERILLMAAAAPRRSERVEG